MEIISCEPLENHFGGGGGRIGRLRAHAPQHLYELVITASKRIIKERFPGSLSLFLPFFAALGLRFCFLALTPNSRTCPGFFISLEIDIE